MSEPLPRVLVANLREKAEAALAAHAVHPVKRIDIQVKADDDADVHGAFLFACDPSIISDLCRAWEATHQEPGPYVRKVVVDLDGQEWEMWVDGWGRMKSMTPIPRLRHAGHALLLTEAEILEREAETGHRL